MIKIALSTALCAVLATASTTMCFKKDHLDPSNIESTPLDGGECKGMFSVEDMKKQGYNVGDIKITVSEAGMNYMYVFNKQKVVIGKKAGVTASGAQVLTKEQLKGYLEELKEEEKIQNEAKRRIANIGAGKIRYEQLCAECHGAKGEKSAYGVSKQLNSMSFEDMKYAIRDYVIDERKSAMALIMKPYAGMMVEGDVENIHSYLESLK